MHQFNTNLSTALSLLGSTSNSADMRPVLNILVDVSAARNVVAGGFIGYTERNRNLVPEVYLEKPAQVGPKPGRAGSLAFPLKFKNQDFVRLRDHCLNHGLLFEDETFPAHIASIGPKLVQGNLHRIKWQRPTDILPNASLVVDYISRFDILQGNIGDCWVLAALGSLTLQQRFLENVIPEGQGFKHNYAGIFHFRFWYFGDWVDVVIDDRLPFVDGKYLFVKPRSRNEFWPPLLEKAYAKLRGSYQKLHWGFIEEALVDLTGGVQMSFELQCFSSSLHEIVKAAAKTGCLMGCITPGKRSTGSITGKNGIVHGHAYTVVEAAELPYMGKMERLIRIWNPYGHMEWNGAWSDSSTEWDRVPKQFKKDLYENKDNGEFWMSYEDFKENFIFLCVCNDVPTFLDFEEQSSSIWSVQTYVNRWVHGLSSEGSTHYKGAPSRKPQYFIQVKEPDTNNSNVVVSLTQKPVNNANNSQLQGIRFQIFKDRTTLYNEKFQIRRDVTEGFHLSPGTYIIIPEILQGGQESEFLLRIFLKSQNNFRPPTTELSPVVTKDMPKWNQGSLYENIFLRYANQLSYLDASQLQRILNEIFLKDLMASLGSRDGFSFDSCRSLLALMDTNANGRLTLQEFEKLWRDLYKYKDIFKREDENNSGFLDISNLRRVTQSAGLFISDKILQLMTVRHGDSAMRMNCSDFVCCMIRLETMAKVFRNLSADGRGIYFTENEWMTMIMYC
ncbi:calpain-13 [Rhineura floridana]|uniref:calpain-13 n=1 Tax=Rhineura floridana TaxID=261503 RepID=UPI002AC81A0B|nr:calpain-13 [Rhineura floridana]